MAYRSVTIGLDLLVGAWLRCIGFGHTFVKCTRHSFHMHRRKRGATSLIHIPGSLVCIYKETLRGIRAEVAGRVPGSRSKWTKLAKCQYNEDR